MNDSWKDKVLTKRVDLADASGPLLAVRFNDLSTDPESPDAYHTITLAPTGSDSSKLLVTVKVGESAGSCTTYKYSGDGAGADETATATLGDLISELNSIEGMTAIRLNAPADYSLNTDDFIALSETNIPPQWLECLYKDASEVLTFALRIGVPEVNAAGLLKLVRVIGFADSASATDCQLKISRDPSDTDASQEVELPYTRYIPDGSITTLWDFHERPPVEQGPILVEVTAASSLAVNAWIQVAYEAAD